MQTEEGDGDFPSPSVTRGKVKDQEGGGGCDEKKEKMPRMQ